MKKLILASVSAVAMLGLAACSDSTDSTTTQSTNPPAETTTPPAASPDTGTGGEMQPADPAQPADPMQPAQ